MSLTLRWVQAYIGLGSNLEHPLDQIHAAKEELAKLEHVEMIGFSHLYQSLAIGPQQPDYINAVAALSTCLSPQKLLDQLHEIENRHGRVRTMRWGPRTLDLDILLFDEKIISEPDLIIPHPELANRAFVLYPLADLVGDDFNIPGHGSLSLLLKKHSPLSLRKINS
jgi:2-amino-4-hydroxy-6-hydroxymethyldihydropteridine diphosphokinase